MSKRVAHGMEHRAHQMTYALMKSELMSYLEVRLLHQSRDVWTRMQITNVLLVILHKITYAHTPQQSLL